MFNRKIIISGVLSGQARIRKMQWDMSRRLYLSARAKERAEQVIDAVIAKISR
jgi:hypothetical protein